MNKLLSCLGLMMVVATTSACTLYFEDDDDWSSYCDDSGCYECPPDGPCYPVGGGPDGWGCSADNECAQGCYCDELNGSCVEAGFCVTDADCGFGYVCDDRESCVPEQPTGGWECETDEDCAAACYCDEDAGYCEESSMCTEDSQCPEGQTCDETRSTCVPDDAPPPPPPPACEELTTEQECLGREDCSALWTGQNCTPTSGTGSCSEPSADCECEIWIFQGCVADAPAAP